jgi:hypothetical protein
MFEQKQNIADLIFFAQVDELPLQAQAGSVIDGAELDESDHTKSISPRRHRGTEKHSFISWISPCLCASMVNYAFIAIPYTLFDASSMASASVGWAWIVHIKSSTVASSSMAATASAINSVACGPMMWTPRISP